MNKLTTKKQMQTWWALAGSRSKLRSKVTFFSILCHFHASLTLYTNVEKLQNRGKWYTNHSSNKTNRKKFGSCWFSIFNTFLDILEPISQ